MIPDDVLSEKLNNLSKRIRLLDKRNYTLNSLCGLLGDAQFTSVVRALETGDLVANGDCVDISDENIQLLNKDEKIDIRTWQNWALNIPRDNSTDTTYLVNSADERAIIKIKLNASQVNRHLNLVGQSGGQSPKMGPKLYAFLAVWYARTTFITDPGRLFGILENMEEVWGERGVINGRRGLDATTEFLDALEQFEKTFEDLTRDLDISIASGS